MAQHNNLKLDSMIGEMSYVQIQASLELSGSTATAYGSERGNKTYRDVVGAILAGKVRIESSGFILFEGTLLELAVVHLRDLRDISADPHGLT